jgi:uncharacterized membrane protein
METTIWILKGIIALIFTFVGVNKIFRSKATLLDNGMKGLIDLNQQQIKAVGILEVLGAFGLILPTLFNTFPVLSAIAALCLCLTMIVAGWINYKLKLSIIPNIVLLVVCILIAIWELK